MVAFALLTVATSFAYEIGDYAYNTTQRFKITGENLVANGNFANQKDGWYGADPETAPNAEVWDLVQGAGPNGETVLQAISVADGQPLCNKWTLSDGGYYIVSFDIKALNAGFTSILTADVTPGSNVADFFLNSDGNFTKVASTEEAPVVNVAAVANFPQEEWKTVVFGFTAETGQQLVMHFEKLPEGTQITNIEVHKAAEVYDIRIAQSRIAFVKTLMEMPEFNTEAAQDAKANLEGIIGMVEEAIASGEMDDPGNAESLMLGLEDEGVQPFMSITSRRMNDKLTGTEDVASLATVGRGANRPATYANLDLAGGNWGHTGSADYLMSAIQNGYAHTATYTAFNTNFPKGRYLFTAEIRNANTGKTSWPCEPTFNLKNACKVFVGNDSIETDTIFGENYQRILHIGDIAEDGQFRAGVYWPGTSSGGAFFIKNVEVYALGDGPQIEANIAHIESWVAFKAQWDAATSNRHTLHLKIGNANLPWEQDSVKAARDMWDPYYLAIVNKGWVAEDGSDAGVATTEELTEWTIPQGFYPTVAEGEDSTFYNRYSQYAVVRGYGDASAWIEAANKPFTDLGNAIEAAKGTRNNGAYLTGDRDTYRAAILAALNTLKTVRETTTDATREADTETLTQALATLNAATEAFLATVSVVPFVDIDFSQGVTENVNPEETEPQESYFFQGTKGRMYTSAWGETNNSGAYFVLGYGEEYLDVLRVGNGSATVYLSEEEQPAEDEAIRFTFDFFHGNLSGKFAGVELRNAADERVAGFYLNRYNGSLSYNDFNDVLTNGGTGMNVLQYATGIGSGSASNAAIAAENNRTSYDLVVDYLNKTLKGTIVNPQRGTNEGAEMPFRADITDHKIVKFVLLSNYNNQDRRCWFDNLKISKYKLLSVEEDITEPTWAEVVDGIQNATVATPNAAIYTISGLKVNKITKPGLYIQNGKKFVVK